MNLIVLLCYLLALSPSEPSGNKKDAKEIKKSLKVKLLQTGNFHEEAVDRRDTSLPWFGLFKSQDGFTLKKVKVKVRYVRDYIIDDDNDAYTGKQVKINDKLEPLILIGGIDSLKEGKLKGKIGKEIVFLPNQPVTVKLGDTVYMIKAYGKCSSILTSGSGDIVVKNYKVKLINTNTGKSQLLYSNMEFEGEGPSLFWIGDIDRDGKPDVIFDERTNYNVNSLALFLSSYAPKGKLVKKMVVWSTTGC